jgi:hypothetical protein
VNAPVVLTETVNPAGLYADVILAVARSAAKARVTSDRQIRRAVEWYIKTPHRLNY